MGTNVRTSKRWPGIGLALSAMVIGFFAGAWLGSVAASPGDGLGGGATVFFGGLVGTALFAVLSILFVKRLTRGPVVKALWIAGPLAVLLIVWFIMRIAGQLSDQGDQWREEQERLRRMKPSATPSMFHFASFTDRASTARPTDTHQPPMGLGMMAPRIEAGSLRMYAAPDLFDPLHHPQLADSLVFAPGPYHMEIAYAPPWFVPAHIKLDYDLLLLRVITLSSHWVEVAVNETDGRTAWVPRSQGIVRLWPEFILGVVAVEIIDPATNPIRIKPLDHASPLADGADALLSPLAVQGDWLLVRTHELADRIQPTGWIRWRKDGRLVVEYSLLC